VNVTPFQYLAMLRISKTGLVTIPQGAEKSAYAITTFLWNKGLNRDRETQVSGIGKEYG
jgi:hypothetical protein